MRGVVLVALFTVLAGCKSQMDLFIEARLSWPSHNLADLNPADLECPTADLDGRWIDKNGYSLTAKRGAPIGNEGGVACWGATDDEARALSIACDEQVVILKAILAAMKEEISARQR